MRFIFLLLFIPITLMAVKGADDICFRNQGKIHAAAASADDILLYVQGAVRLTDSCSIRQDGSARIFGSLYQDSDQNGFVTDEEGYGQSSGSIIFSGSRPEGSRTISSDNAAYLRADNYAAFPHIRIDTNDTIFVPGYMGMDALTIRREEGRDGLLWLMSDVTDGATLRITSPGSSSQTDKGCIVVEREVTPYRGSLYPFASPYTDLPAVYFAGNWLRKPLLEKTNNHCSYVYAEKPSDDGSCIHRDQYHVSALEILDPVCPYFLCLRSSDFNYADVPGGYNVTAGLAAEKYNLDKFIFNGLPFDLPGICEAGRLFSDDKLIDYSYTGEGTTINWIIGNSYTAPLDYSKVIEVMNKSSLRFSPVFYMYLPGTTTFTAYNIQTDEAPAIDIPETIPPMSVFMVRVSRNGAQNGSLVLDRSLQTHGRRSKGVEAQGAARRPYSDILFTVHPERNPHMYDRTVIGMRDEALLTLDALDMPKVQNRANDQFSLYTLAADGNTLLSNAVPYETSSIRINFDPAAIPEVYVLKASRIETMDRAEALLLHDELANQWIDLRAEREYVFTSSPGDQPERFKLYFSKENIIIDDLYGFWFDRHLHFKNLREEDLGSVVHTYDCNGRLLRTHVIDSYPACSIPVDVPEGFYLSKVTGRRTTAVKFLNIIQ